MADLPSDVTRRRSPRTFIGRYKASSHWLNRSFSAEIKTIYHVYNVTAVTISLTEMARKLNLVFCVIFLQQSQEASSKRADGTSTPNTPGQASKTDGIELSQSFLQFYKRKAQRKSKVREFFTA